MASTPEMIRLMRHAADLLDACDPAANARLVSQNSSVTSVRESATTRAAAEAVALGTASAVLRMVAAAMDDEPAKPPLERGPDGRFRRAIESGEVSSEPH